MVFCDGSCVSVKTNMTGEGTMFKRFVVLILCSLIFSCGYMVSVKPGNMLSNQKKIEFKDNIYIISRQNESIAIAGPVNSPCSSNMRLRVELLVENLKDAPSDFLFHEIAASFNGIPLKVFSYSELVQEVEIHRSNQRIILKGRRFGHDDGGDGIYHMMYDDRNYPPGSLNQESGRYFKEPSSETKQYVEKTGSGFIQTAMYSDDFDLSKLYRESLQNRVLKKGQPYSGILVIEHPAIAENNSGANELILSVKIGGEVHQFNFNLLKLERK